MKQELKNSKSRKGYLDWLFSEGMGKFLAATGVVLLVGGTIAFLWMEGYNSQRPLNAEKVAQYGDFIGGLVGAIWALAGVIIFFVALRDQRKDMQTNSDMLETQTEALKNQIIEFKLQTTEFEETRVVLKEQSDTLIIQRFENTFFNLISLLQETISHLSLKGMNNVMFTQRQVFNRARIRINSKFTQQSMSSSAMNPYERLKFEIPKVFQGEINGQLDHYFNLLYSIYKSIYLSELVQYEKKSFYASICTAQLSTDEKYLLYYYCLLSKYGHPNFLFLAKEYAILTGVPRDALAHPSHHAIFENQLLHVTPDHDLKII